MKRGRGALALLAVAVVGTPGLSSAAFTSRTSSGVSAVTAASDWTPPRVALTVPGTPLSGIVEVTADAFDQEAATTVRVDVSPSGHVAWSELCAPAAPPLTCVWDTTAWSDGTYDLRAVATDASGNTADAVTTDVRLDNTP